MQIYGTLVIAVISAVVYHLIQKIIPAAANPMLTLAATYAAALLICLLLLSVFPLTAPLAVELGKINWTSLVLGASVVGIEIGFLLSYRAGWNVNVASLVANTAVAVLLIPLGLALFRERLSLAQIGGALLCLLGLVLINRG